MTGTTDHAGTLVLQGGAPFVGNDELDRRLLGAVDRVVVLPTADAFEQPHLLVAAAVEWGRRIGVAVEPAMVLTRRDADDAAASSIDGAEAVFLAGDSSNHLRSVLKDTPVFAALERLLARGGTVLAAGSSASALCDPMTDRRGGAFALGLGLVTGLAVLTEAESWPSELLARARSLADTAMAEIPTGGALVRRGGSWETVGAVVVHGELPD